MPVPTSASFHCEYSPSILGAHPDHLSLCPSGCSSKTGNAHRLSDVLIPDPVHPGCSQRDPKHFYLLCLQLRLLSRPLLRHCSATLVILPILKWSYKEVMNLRTLGCFHSKLKPWFDTVVDAVWISSRGIYSSTVPCLTTSLVRIPHLHLTLPQTPFRCFRTQGQTDRQTHACAHTPECRRAGRDMQTPLACLI